MTNTLNCNAHEGSTFGILCNFVEVTQDGEEGSPIIPNSGLKWSLKDKHGVVINGRLDVPLTPAAEVTIVLQGDDLALPVDAPTIRYLTVEGTYDSVLGTNLPLKDEVAIHITNLVGVS